MQMALRGKGNDLEEALVISEDVIQLHIPEVMAMLLTRGAVSLRALRELLQIHLNASLVGRRSDIRKLATIVAEEFCCGARRIDSYAPVWESLPMHTCLGRTCALVVASSDTRDRGRCVLSSLSDFGHSNLDNLAAKFQQAEGLGMRYASVGDVCAQCFRKTRRPCSSRKIQKFTGELVGSSFSVASDSFCKVLTFNGQAEQLGKLIVKMPNEGLAMRDIIQDGRTNFAWGGSANSTASLLRALASAPSVWDPGGVWCPAAVTAVSGAVRLAMKESTLNDDGGAQLFVKTLAGKAITLVRLPRSHTISNHLLCSASAE